MTDDQPDYTQDVSVTVIDTADELTVNFPSQQDVNITGQTAALTTTPSLPYIAGRTASFENPAFVSGSSPATHDVNAALGRNAHDGYIHNAGTGDLQYSISDNGTDYGGTHTLAAGAKAKLTGLDIDSIKITWVADTKYYIMVV